MVHSGIDDLYQEVVMDHGSNPRNMHRLTDPSSTAHGFNPFCGDIIDVDLSFATKSQHAETIADIGFDGKGCIHPRQIQPIHEEFSPSNSEIERAKKIVLAFKEASKKGLGVVSLGSKMIDPPVVKRAQHTMDLAILTGLVSSNWKQK